MFFVNVWECGVCVEMLKKGELCCGIGNGLLDEEDVRWKGKCCLKNYIFLL